LHSLHIILLIFSICLYSETELTGDRKDVVRLVKRCMNQAIGKRLIPKQEAVVLLAGLDLVLCSETIKPVSVSNSKQIRESQDENTHKTFLKQYKERGIEFEEYSLYEYFMFGNRKYTSKQKEIIPHFTGICGRPVYPITEAYAKQTLVIYRPWRDYPTSGDFVAEFNNFIRQDTCPHSVRMTYNRVFSRFMSGREHCEAVAKKADYSRNAIGEDIKELIALTGLHDAQDDEYDADTALLKSLDRGLDYRWDRTPEVRNQSQSWNFLSPLQISHASRPK